MKKEFDYIVIGGGSGGIASARRAAAHGAKVLLIEKNRLGGTCVNVGCVPKKVMFNAASIAEAIKDSREYGFETESGPINFQFLKNARDSYIDRLNGIYAKNLDNSGVTILEGKARFHDENVIQVGSKKFQSKHILIATGGRPKFPKIEGSSIGISSDGFFKLETLPKKSIIVGAGYIAVELAGVLNALGSKVDLFIRRNEVLKDFDPCIRNGLKSAMLESGITIHENSDIKSAARNEKGQNPESVFLELASGRSEDANAIIWAIGREPNTDMLGLEKTSIELNESGQIKVNDHEETTQAGVYAIGDVIGGAELTPVAIKAGRKLADRLFGKKSDLMNYDNIPTVIFSHPPCGAVGLTEIQAKEKYGADVKVYSTEFVNMYFSLTNRKQKTIFKLVTTGSDDRIVGAHAIGMGVDEMMQGIAIALKSGSTKADFDETVAIHPTGAEEWVLL